MIPRWLPERPFPPYTHVPGRTPHPISDPAGHHFGQAPRPLDAFDPANWRECPAYLHGIDLFNHGFYWEAHEAWEALWHSAGRRGSLADFIKSLIQLAVAGVKYYEEKPIGRRTHALRAAELARSCGYVELLGLKAESIIRLGEQLARDAWPEPPPRLSPVLPVMA